MPSQVRAKFSGSGAGKEKGRISCGWLNALAAGCDASYIIIYIKSAQLRSRDRRRKVVLCRFAVSLVFFPSLLGLSFLLLLAMRLSLFLLAGVLVVAECRWRMADKRETREALLRLLGLPQELARHSFEDPMEFKWDDCGEFVTRLAVVFLSVLPVGCDCQ